MKVKARVGMSFVATTAIFGCVNAWASPQLNAGNTASNSASATVSAASASDPDIGGGISLLPDDLIQIEGVVANGSGCPEGLGGTVIDFDPTTGFVNLDINTYSALATATHKLDRKTCDVAVPIVVPAGKRAVISDATLYGYAQVSTGGQSRINLEAFAAGSSGDVVSQTLVTHSGHASSSGVFVVQQNTPFYTDCGQTTNLRLNTSILNQSLSGSGQAYSTGQGLSFLISLEDCQ